jgi:gas vesicle protein
MAGARKKREACHQKLFWHCACRYRAIDEETEGAMNDGFDSESNGSGSMAFLTGLIAGGVIGAGLGLLFAPRPGSELRAELADQAASASAKMSKTVDDLAQRGRDVLDRARSGAAQAGEELNRAADRA